MPQRNLSKLFFLTNLPGIFNSDGIQSHISVLNNFCGTKRSHFMKLKSDYCLLLSSPKYSPNLATFWIGQIPKA